MPTRDASAPDNRPAAPPGHVLEAATEPEYTEPLTADAMPVDAVVEVDEPGLNPEEESDLLTYEPPAAVGDEDFDFGTAAPPAVGARALVIEPPEPPETAPAVVSVDQLQPAPDRAPEQAVQTASRQQHDARPQGAASASHAVTPNSADASPAGATRHVAAGAGDPEAPSGHDPCVAAQPDAAGSAPDAPAGSASPSAVTTAGTATADRVNELLAGFGQARERSSREVAGDLKQMLGLAPTPPPPTVGISTDAAKASEAAGEAVVSRVLPPIEFARPRRPKLGIGLAVILLIFAIAGLGVLYLAYPQLLLHR